MAINKTNIKAVIFDWGGVFCTPAEPFALAALQQYVNMNVEQIADAVRETYNDYYKGVYVKETFWPMVLTQLGVSENEEINTKSLNMAYMSSYQLFPEMFELVKRLKGAGLSVSLLSNLTPDMRDNIQVKHRIQDYFTPDTYSCDLGVGVLKPDMRIYQIALEKIGKTPSQCLFIDDSKNNIEAARVLGFETLLFENTGQCLQVLQTLL
jgi:putative hydrolase of the HAD superfamily